MNPAVDIGKMISNKILRQRAVAVVLAGGRGSRLMALTDTRAKPAVFFGGKFRLIDFPLSNCVNSGIRRISIITQYRAHSLIRHVQRGWNFLHRELNEVVELLPAQQQIDEGMWYRGTADAVYQNLAILRNKRPQWIVILAGDHVYKMDYSIMLEDHVQSGRPCTVGCIEVPLSEAQGFGIMSIDDQRRITAFQEKPAEPQPMPGRPGHALASMGIYVFDAEYLFSVLEEDQGLESSRHDFGRDIIPKVVGEGQALAHPFALSCVKSAPDASDYWRDVGTLDSYWEANLELAAPLPPLDIYNNDWPIWTYQFQLPPAKFTPGNSGAPGSCSSSLISSGCILAGSRVVNSVLFSNVHVASDSVVENCVILPGTQIGPGSVLRNAVVDCAMELPPGFMVGIDAAADAERFTRSPRGVSLVAGRQPVAGAGGSRGNE
jgi:glucose-1-phosphate adenylyltransferase